MSDITDVAVDPDLIGRFLLFAGESYYPAPSWDEFRGAYLTQQDASRAVHERRIPRSLHMDEVFPDMRETIQWYQIVDLQILSVVEHGGYGYGGDDSDAPTAVTFGGYDLPAKEPL